MKTWIILITLITVLPSGLAQISKNNSSTNETAVTPDPPCSNQIEEKIAFIVSEMNNDSADIYVYKINQSFDDFGTVVRMDSNCLAVDSSRLDLILKLNHYQKDQVINSINKFTWSYKTIMCYSPGIIVVCMHGERLIGGFEICKQCEKINAFSNHDPKRIINVCSSELGEFISLIEGYN